GAAHVLDLGKNAIDFEQLQRGCLRRVAAQCRDRRIADADFSLTRLSGKKCRGDFSLLGREALEQGSKQIDLLEALGGLRNPVGCLDELGEAHVSRLSGVERSLRHWAP